MCPMNVLCRKRSRYRNFYSCRFALKEIVILWRFISNDIKDTIVPSVIAFFNGWIYVRPPIRYLPGQLLFSLIYASLYIYTFCISNQLHSIAEDAINKPYRPLPTGFVTQKETKIRFWIYNALFLILAFYLHIFFISVAWMVVTAGLNQWGWSSHWLTKNHLGMSLGTFILFTAQWSIASPEGEIGGNVYWYFALLSIWAGSSLPIQDFRDVEGDRLMGRNTLTISLGEEKGRLVMIFQYLIISPALVLIAMLTQVTMVHLLGTILLRCLLLVEIGVHWYIAYRIWYFRNPKEDDFTYHVYVFLFCALVPMLNILRASS